MASQTPPADGASQPPTPGEGAGELRRPRALRISFCALVVLLAAFQFSENTADPDLWGHIVFGQQMLQTGAIPRAEIYSWTAQGQPWINHEWLSEIVLGGAHAWLGGSGVLLLKMGVGLLTFALCLRLGGAGAAWPAGFITWAFGALAVVEISYGFAPRPQIFTALGLALELMLLRRIHAGSFLYALALPVLFLFWINAHGGALAGFGLLGLAAAATTAQVLWPLISRRQPPAGPDQSPDLPLARSRTALVLWLALGGVAAALFCTPWKAEMLRWLIVSVLWMRPEIQEWNPTPLGWDHTAFFVLIVLGILAWTCSRRQRAWWELAACAAFALLGLRSVRNAPLFSLVALALAPPHLADVLARFRRFFARWEMRASNPALRDAAGALCAAGMVGVAVSMFTLHKEHPLTMEAPRSRYPVGAVDFLLNNQLRGRMLAFFDWGEMVIFEAPGCSPSMDGRLDECYSRELIAAHWNFYNGAPFDQKLLNPDQADLALLPGNLAGAGELARRPGWKAVYFDDTAVILARDAGRFPKLQKLNLPVAGPAGAARGRARFPDRNPRWRTNESGADPNHLAMTNRL